MTNPNLKVYKGTVRSKDRYFGWSVEDFKLVAPNDNEALKYAGHLGAVQGGDYYEVTVLVRVDGSKTEDVLSKLREQGV